MFVLFPPAILSSVNGHRCLRIAHNSISNIAQHATFFLRINHYNRKKIPGKMGDFDVTSRF